MTREPPSSTRVIRLEQVDSTACCRSFHRQSLFNVGVARSSSKLSIRISANSSTRNGGIAIVRHCKRRYRLLQCLTVARGHAVTVGHADLLQHTFMSHLGILATRQVFVGCFVESNFATLLTGRNPIETCQIISKRYQASLNTLTFHRLFR